MQHFGLQTFSSPPTLHVICHAYLMLTFPLSLLSRCSVDLAGDWSAGSPLLLSLESGSWGGRADSCVPLHSVWVFLSGQNQLPAIGVHGSSSPVLLGSAQLISWLRESAAAAQDSPSTNWSLPTPPTPPCHHGAVTTATRWTVSVWHTFRNMWLRYEDVRIDEWIYTVLHHTTFTFIYSHTHWHLHSCPVTTAFFWCCRAALKEWTWLGAFLRGTLKGVFQGGKSNIHFRAATKNCFRFQSIWLF